MDATQCYLIIENFLATIDVLWTLIILAVVCEQYTVKRSQLLHMLGQVWGLYVATYIYQEVW